MPRDMASLTHYPADELAFNDTAGSLPALNHIRKESLDIYNRLHSIAEDVEFVNSILKSSEYSHLPLIANLRCGAWYADPKLAMDIPAYFKSTDGHFGNWGFNLRRPNLHLLPVVAETEGMILVDSTRAGKRIPDALSKTVAIWCAVINRALVKVYEEYQSREDWDTNLYTPPGAVSAQEHHQIGSRLDHWADELSRSTYQLPRLSKPLRPLWITPSTATLPKPLEGYINIICLSASKQVERGEERRSGSFVYVQGSGDDHELWGMGITPEIFWKHKDTLLSAERADMPELVQKLLAQHASSTPENIHPPSQIGPTALSITALRHMANFTPPPNQAFLLLPPPDHAFNRGNAELKNTKNVLIIPAQDGKKGQKEFVSDVLPRSILFIEEQLRQGRQVCIACNSGKDMSVGVALAALQRFYGDDGVLLPQERWGKDPVSKSSIKTRLQWIISSRPLANPSRATLKRVNEFLLSPPIYLRSSTLVHAATTTQSN